MPQNWMTPIIQYLTYKILPNDQASAKKVRMQAAKYILLGNELYKREISTPMLKCLDEDQASYVIRKIHEDNGLQFTDCRFNEFLEGLHIKHRVTSVEHPQTNVQAEAANKVILHELRRRLGSAKGEWVKRLPEILWAQCTPQTATKETPFRLTYGTDAMVPVEIGEPLFQRQNFQESTNDESLAVNLDLLEEVRGQAAIVAEASKRIMSRKFNSKIKPR
ncbi:uncharacterized protein LOC113874287 [Abrus precatorius]|uniref:Uncharacterized protein LOC113874287 n=1 Tax=Abrus precatorius TaxID=3816 RepID=A0A8B8MIC2_ABRPR|nr:uncharacterized protein LOC113874287 [Abrus precatorius]